MDRNSHSNRRPAIVLLLGMFACMAAFMSPSAGAGDSFLLQSMLDDLKDGDIMLAPIGRRGAGVRMSIQAQGQGQGTVARFMPGDNGIWQAGVSASEVHLSVVIPW